MVKADVEVEALTAVELVEALQQLVYRQDSEHFMVLRAVGFIDDDGVRPRWGASLTLHMPNMVDARLVGVNNAAIA